MQNNTLSKKSILIFRIRYTFLEACACFLLGMIGVFHLNLCLVLIFFSLITYLYLFLFYSPRRYSKTHYRLTSNTFTLSKGVFFLKTKTLNLDRIQYIEITRSIEQRLLSVCTIIFHTAGSKITLSQLDLKTGLLIKKQIYERIRDEA